MDVGASRRLARIDGSPIAVMGDGRTASRAMSVDEA